MDEKWIMSVEGVGKVRVADELNTQLSTYRQLKASQPESGGVLLGKHLNSNGAMLIDGLTPPQPSDKQGRCSFYRSKQHSKLAEQAWKQSNGHVTYVGLWHTHPEPVPTPSSQDLKDWKKALRKSQFEGKHLFFFIVGQTHIRCWVGKKSAFKTEISFLEEYEYGE